MFSLVHSTSRQETKGPQKGLSRSQKDGPSAGARRIGPQHPDHLDSQKVRICLYWQKRWVWRLKGRQSMGNDGQVRYNTIHRWYSTLCNLKSLNMVQTSLHSFSSINSPILNTDVNKHILLLTYRSNSVTLAKNINRQKFSRDLSTDYYSVVDIWKYNYSTASQAVLVVRGSSSSISYICMSGCCYIIILDMRIPF